MLRAKVKTGFSPALGMNWATTAPCLATVPRRSGTRRPSGRRSELSSIAIAQLPARSHVASCGHAAVAFVAETATQHHSANSVAMTSAAPKNFARRDKLLEIEGKAQAKWERENAVVASCGCFAMPCVTGEEDDEDARAAAAYHY